MTVHSLLQASPPALVILDFDGVIADSELLANTLLAEFLTFEGLPTTVDQAMSRYMGRRWADCEARIADDLGRPIGTDFQERYRAHTGGRMRSEVQPIPGIAALLHANRNQRFCVASSSHIDWLNHGTDKFGLRPYLGVNLFSATEVANGKPAPDIFLLAAARMSCTPEHCIVIEDSTAGIQGAVAAGMTAIGFVGGSHSGDGHADKLLAAGAKAITRTHNDVARVVGLQGQHVSG